MLNLIELFPKIKSENSLKNWTKLITLCIDLKYCLRIVNNFFNVLWSKQTIIHLSTHAHPNSFYCTENCALKQEKPQKKIHDTSYEWKARKESERENVDQGHANIVYENFFRIHL